MLRSSDKEGGQLHFLTTGETVDCLLHHSPLYFTTFFFFFLNKLVLYKSAHPDVGHVVIYCRGFQGIESLGVMEDFAAHLFWILSV